VIQGWQGLLAGTVGEMMEESYQKTTGGMGFAADVGEIAECRIGVGQGLWVSVGMVVPL